MVQGAAAGRDREGRAREVPEPLLRPQLRDAVLDGQGRDPRRHLCEAGHQGWHRALLRLQPAVERLRSGQVRPEHASVQPGCSETGLPCAAPPRAVQQLRHTLALRRCECGAASCVGWLGGRSAAQRAQERLHDSDDEAEACALYLDEDADGATKVQQLSTGPALPLPGHAVRPRLPPGSCLTARAPAVRPCNRGCWHVSKDRCKEAPPAPAPEQVWPARACWDGLLTPAVVQAVDARRKARPGPMADPLPEAQVHAIVDSFLQAPCRYPSPYDALECAPGAAVPAAVREQWDGAREGAEQRWRGHEAAVKQLLLGMQGLGYATARVKRGAV